ncbi:MAG: hypothetical protein KDA65_02620 [Planctomycetaceae bacterium]|nr:hypothetical protein [Planctomycetaceae bacterium]
MSLLGIALLTGCQSTAKREVLEARLRDQSDEILVLNRKIGRLEEELTVRTQEADALRVQMVGTGNKGLLKEQANALYQVTGIQINKLLTGGLDHDGEPGDEAISVLLSPHDQDGSLVKLSGKLLIEVIDHSHPDEDEVIGQWEFSPSEMKAHWHSGFIGVGYLFDLGWQQLPKQEELIIHARLITGDERQFDVTEKIRIEPPTSLPQANSSPQAIESDGAIQALSAFSFEPPPSNPPSSRPTSVVSPQSEEPPLGFYPEEHLIPVQEDQRESKPATSGFYPEENPIPVPEDLRVTTTKASGLYPGEEPIPVPEDQGRSIPDFEETGEASQYELSPTPSFELDEPGYLKLPTIESSNRTKFDDFPLR